MPWVLPLPFPLPTTPDLTCELKFQFAVIPFCMKNFPLCEPNSDAIVHGPFCSVQSSISSVPGLRGFPQTLCIINVFKSVIGCMSRVCIFCVAFLN